LLKRTGRPGRRIADLIDRGNRMTARGRLVGWLLMFICAYRLGLPVLYAAALAALPWLLLPAAPAGKPNG
jgi:hypothetical protein